MSKWRDLDGHKVLVKIRCPHDHGHGESFVVGKVVEIGGMAFLYLRDALPLAEQQAMRRRAESDRRMSRDWQISERMWMHRAAGSMTTEADGSISIVRDHLYPPWCPVHKELELSDWTALFNALTAAVAKSRRQKRPSDLVVPIFT